MTATIISIAQNVIKKSFSGCRSFLILLFLLGASAQAQAQYYTNRISYGDDRSPYSVELGAGIDVPLGNLKDSYKAAPYVEGIFSRDLGHFTISIGAGYRAFTPSQSTVTTPVGDGTDQTINIANFTSYQFYTSAVYNFDLSSNVVLFTGINLGSYITTYGASANSDNFAVSANQTEEEAYVAPKIGVGFKLGAVQLNLSARYNLFYTGGYVAYDSTYGGYSNSGTLYQSIAGGVSVSYHF
jgi:hypothetical protein